MAVLFGKDINTVNRYIKNIYEEGELDKNSTIKDSLTVQCGKVD